MDRRLVRRCLPSVAALVALAAPGPVSAHRLSGRFVSPLPLGAYLTGAALAVGLSFAFLLLRAGPAAAVPGGSGGDPRPERTFGVGRPVRLGLGAIGLIGWAWVVLVVGLLGSETEGDPASLFLWTYGWVAIPILSAAIGPLWTWLDPFSTLQRLGAGVLRRLRIGAAEPVPYPARLGQWPAAIGFAVVVWLELAVPAARGGRTLGLVLVGYTALTLLGMAWYGRDAWRRNADVFSVWFALVGRLAPLATTADAGRLRVRGFGSGLLEPGWSRAGLVLVAVATGGILFDGLSQTQAFFDAFGRPGVAEMTVLLAAFLGLVAGSAIVVSRVVGVAALGAGLVPIALGYLVAHYLTFLLFDGQRILLLLDDPLGQGAHLLGLSRFEPLTDWLPAGVAWALQLTAVVGGHLVGAWAGHAVAIRDGLLAGRPLAAIRGRQVPLALQMVGLTALTLWSLGQAIVTQAPGG